MLIIAALAAFDATPGAVLARDRDDTDANRTLLRRGSLSQLEHQLDALGEPRARALRQLAELPTRRAVRALGQWLADAPPLSDVEWIRVASALAPHAGHATANKWLGKILGGAPLDEPESEDGTFARQIAAVAMARSGDSSNLRTLGRALKQSTAQARFAREALLAYPPTDLGPLLAAPGEPSVALVLTLQHLGDQRAFHALRGFVRKGPAPVQAAAALALYHHGHLETLELARFWRARATGQAPLLAAATEILLATRTPEAAGAIDALLDANPGQALALLRRYPSTVGAKALLKHFERLQPSEQHQALGVMAALGSGAVTSHLERLLGDPQLGDAAAFALGRSADPGASIALLKALEGGARRSSTSTAANARRLRSARALVVRGWLNGRLEPKFETWLQSHRHSKRADERWIAQWGLAATSTAAASDELRSDDWIGVGAAAASLLIQPIEVWERAIELLPRANSERTRRALAASLGRNEVAAQVTTSQLYRAFDESPGLTPVLARPLASRRDELRPFVVADLLTSNDVAVRSNALRGLGVHPDGASLGLLRRAYEGQTQLALRQAAIDGIARRPASAARDRVLRWAREYDPDPTIRHWARLGLANATPTLPSSDARGHQVVWLSLAASEPGDLVVVATPDGRCFPTLVPPDRTLVVLGFADERFVVRWHPETTGDTPAALGARAR